MADPAVLETVLVRTASTLPIPVPDTFAAAVVERIQAEPSGAAPPPRWRRPALIALAAAAVLALLVALLPPARSAVADFLGIGGVRISSAPATTTPASSAPSTTFASTPDDPYAGLRLAHVVALDAARAAVDFPVRLPAAPGYETPDAVYLGTPPPGGMVSLVYAPGVDRPAPPTAPVGVLLSEFRADLDEAFAKKLISTGTTVEFLTLDGAAAVWISGPAHAFGYTRPDGSYGTEDLRLAANTLLWVRAGITYRLESALGRDAAVALASTVR
jgi:hypothetical protein